MRRNLSKTLLGSASKPMPSTTIYNFANDEIKLRWQEPYMTEAVNRREIGADAPGVYRGFKLEPSVGVLSVTVAADPAGQDHVAKVGLANAYMLHLRRAGGDFALDLSAYTNKTVVIAVYGVYGISITTAAQIRIYELSPTDDFTGDPDRPYLTVLGTVVVPAAGVIPAANITHSRRTSAWQQVPEEAKEWRPLLLNSLFNDGPTANPLLGEQCPSWKLSPLTGNGHWAAVAAAGPSGRNALRISPDVIASPISARATQTMLLPVRPGQILRWRTQYKVDQVPTAGVLKLQMQFVTDEDAVAYTTVDAYTYDLSALTASFVTFEHVVEVPAGAKQLAAVEVIATVDLTYAVASANGVRLGEVQVWAQPDAEALPDVDRRYAKGYFACFGMRLDDYPTGSPDHAVYNAAVDTDFRLQLAGSGALLAAIRTDRSATNTTQPGYRAYGAMEAGYAGLTATSDSHRARFRAYYDPSHDWANILEAVNATAGTTVPLRAYQMSNLGGFLGGFAFVWGSRLRTTAPYYEWERTNTVTRALRLLVAGGASSPGFLIQQATSDGNEATWTTPYAFYPSLAGVPTAVFTGKLELGSGLTGAGEDLIPRLRYYPKAAARTLLTYSDQGSVTRAEYINSVGEHELVINAYWDGTQWNRSSAGDACLIRVDDAALRVLFRDAGDASPWNDASWGYGDLYGGSLALERANPFVLLTGDNSASAKNIYVGFKDFTHLSATDAVEKNALYAQNVAKVWANVTTGGAPAINDGFGVTSVAVVGGVLELTIQHAIAGAPVRGAVVVTTENNGGTPTFYTGSFNAGGTKVLVQAFDNTNAVVDLSAVTQRISIAVFGRTTLCVLPSKSWQGSSPRLPAIRRISGRPAASSSPIRKTRVGPSRPSSPEAPTMCPSSSPGSPRHASFWCR